MAQASSSRLADQTLATTDLSASRTATRSSCSPIRSLRAAQLILHHPAGARRDGATAPLDVGRALGRLDHRQAVLPPGRLGARGRHRHPRHGSHWRGQLDAVSLRALDKPMACATAVNGTSRSPRSDSSRIVSSIARRAISNRISQIEKHSEQDHRFRIMRALEVNHRHCPSMPAKSPHTAPHHTGLHDARNICDRT